jgi:hypothetical protein
MTAERDWEDVFTELITEIEASTANCRHCLKRIHLVPGTVHDGRPAWEDENGFPACVKSGLRIPDYPGQAGGAIACEPVLHDPMPASLGGAPA